MQSETSGLPQRHIPISTCILLEWAWTEAFRGLIADQAQCLARSHVKPWATAYKWPRQKGFSFSLYGEEESNRLAQQWQEKGHFYCSLWIDRSGGSYEYRFTAEELASFVPTEAWLDWLVLKTRLAWCSSG